MRRFGMMGVALMGLVASTAGGCSSEVEEAGGEGTGAVSQEPSKWAVDMKKVSREYGETSKYFFGLDANETDLKEVYNAVGQKIVWDQTFHRDMNHELVQGEGDVAVILEDGTKVKADGHVNIVPILRDTDPSQQVHIRKVMQDGDILVYFHPEYTETKDQMERRTSHVAMHYDYKAADGLEYVHHIDNPNGYGPQYNHEPERRMPFHVLRFKPKANKTFRTGPAAGAVVVENVAFAPAQAEKVLAFLKDTSKTAEAIARETRVQSDAARNIVNARERLGSIADLARVPQVGTRTLERLRDTVGGPAGAGGESIQINAEMAKAYGKAARNWGFIDNDTSPFADFFTLNLQKTSDLSKFVGPAISGQEIPEVYCSGLAYVNLNLALNYPKNRAGLGSLYDQFASKRYEFSDTGESLGKDVLEDDGRLVKLDRLVFEPYAASDIVGNWVETYLAKLPMPVRQQVLSSPALQQQIIEGLRQLAWSGDAAKPSARNANDESVGPANPKNAERFAKAYGQPASATAAYLAADAELKAAFESLDIPVDGLTPMDVFQAVEKKTVTNRFVPPRIWMDEADREDSDLVYVATVLNCELLSAKDGSSADPCAGGDQGSREFKEGAADTTTYADYKIANGKELSHRRFNVGSGPRQMGSGTKFTLRASAADITDVLFVVHTPEMWKGHPLADLSLVELYRKCNELYARGETCAPDIGIALDPARATINAGQVNAGPVNEAEFTFYLDEICIIESPTKMKCPIMKRGADGKWTDAGYQEISRGAYGPINATMIEFGQKTAPATFPRCELCSQGGGHFNGWNVVIRDDEFDGHDVDGDDEFEGGH